MNISEVTDEAPGVRTFRLNFQNEDEGKNFKFQAGQFALYSAFGYGESTFVSLHHPQGRTTLNVPSDRPGG